MFRSDKKNCGSFNGHYYFCFQNIQIMATSELKYAPFSSSIHPGFWSALTKLKLEVLGLEDTAVDIHGQYVNQDQDQKVIKFRIPMNLKVSQF